MQGCRQLLLLGMLLSAAGCHDDAGTVPPVETPVADAAPNSFDPATAGSIQGRVTWQGDPPQVPPFQVHAYLDSVNASRLCGAHPNPNAPRIDPPSRGVGEAALLLRHVKPAPAKPWPHPPVQVEMRSERLTILQGGARRQIGFVERGAEASFVSRDDTYHTLRCRGTAFFTLPFAVADQPTRRRLHDPGVVELSEGAGLYWRRAYLFVLDHPYVALTDRAGHFVLTDVPEGTYQLTAWLPNWRVERHERDPETAVVSRIVFAPAVELVRTVHVVAGQRTEAAFQFEAAQFKRGGNAAQ